MRVFPRPLRAGLAATALCAGLIATAAQAGPLLADMADRALKCAIEPGFYIDPKAETLSTFAFSDDGKSWTDITVPLVAPGLADNQKDQFVVVVPAGPGRPKASRVAFIRTLEKPEPGTKGKPRVVVSMHVDGDTVGDECAVEKGRKPYAESRFDSVRETVCGNDPAPACERLLAKACGPEPTPACTAAAVPELKKATKAYMDKMNARAGQPVR
ncbi:hypothetical protein [Azorhizobium doebereinerae]|uniref:hypothetical protein n=1 Tax=Azorhizobium doebereinerae TaxID=281091 RepID=UPI0003F4ED35|nr:hypothetical protein [Azorhizobium doebereinerae]